MMKIDNSDNQNKFYHSGHKMRLILFSFQRNKTLTLYIYYWENSIEISTVYLNSSQLNNTNQQFLPIKHHNGLDRCVAVYGVSTTYNNSLILTATYRNVNKNERI